MKVIGMTVVVLLLACGGADETTHPLPLRAFACQLGTSYCDGATVVHCVDTGGGQGTWAAVDTCTAGATCQGCSDGVMRCASASDMRADGWACGPVRVLGPNTRPPAPAPAP